MSNREELINFVRNKKYSVYCFSETHVTNDIQDIELNIDDYYTIRCDSHSRYTGGIIMYVHGYIQAEILCNVNIDKLTSTNGFNLYIQVT